MSGMTGNNRYILYKKIARGGMAEIYLGKQTGRDNFQRVCCIKRILPHFAQEQEFIKMFRDEAHICKRLQHANITRVEGFEEVEGSYAIIMEFINGGDLRAVLAACEKSNHRLSVAMCAYIAAEAARGLHYAHCKVDDIDGTPLDIVHRDISPQNILLSFEGEVKVTDFGIADADDKSTETRPGIVKGKYSYMSPEQISARPVDARTDVFALSVVLWEMLAMRRLFQADNEVMTIQKVKNCQINLDLRELNKDLDPTLFAIVARGLKKDPRERFASAAEMERALRKYLSRHFSGFTVSDLSEFLKMVMSARRQELQEEIRNLLAIDVRSQQEEQDDKTHILAPGMSPSSLSRSAEIDLSLEDQTNAPSFELKRGGTQSPGGVQGEIRSGDHNLTHAGTRVAPSTPNILHRAGTSVPLRGYRNAPQNYPSSSSSRGGRHKQKKSGPRSLFSTGSVLMMTFLIIAVAVAVRIYRNQQLNTAPHEIEVLTTPTVLQVMLNDRLLFGGRFVETPLKISQSDHMQHYFIHSQRYKDGPFQLRQTEQDNTTLPETLVFRKTGYADEVFTFNLSQDTGQKYVVLAKTANMAPTRISLSAPGKPVWMQLDNGIISTQIAYDVPVDAKDIIFGIPHTLYIYPYGFRNRNGAFICTFSPRSRNWSAPYLVQINVSQKKCDYP